MSEITLLNIDCMEYMASCKDKQFDLAIEYDGKDFVLKDEVKQKDAFDELIINNLK